MLRVDALSLELPAAGGERRQLGELEIAIDLAVYCRIGFGQRRTKTKVTQTLDKVTVD